LRVRQPTGATFDNIGKFSHFYRLSQLSAPSLPQELKLAHRIIKHGNSACMAIRGHASIREHVAHNYQHRSSRHRHPVADFRSIWEEGR
jgi:hypothetical protein